METIVAIGEEAGLPMWDRLSPELQAAAVAAGRKGEYYVGRFKDSTPDFPTPVLLYRRINSSAYVYGVNMNTRQPTQRSAVRHVPSAALMDKLLPEAKVRKILFFDTETNGLRYGDRNFAVLQIDWRVHDLESGEELLHESEFVRPPEGMQWDEGSQRVHGITPEKLLADGQDPQDVFSRLLQSIEEVDLLVAHNVAFDKNAVKAELGRYFGARAAEIVAKKPTFCTMSSTKTLVGIKNSAGGFKAPKLGELAAFLGVPIDAAKQHCASYDTECLVHCFKELLARGHVTMLTNACYDTVLNSMQ